MWVDGWNDGVIEAIALLWSDDIVVSVLLTFPNIFKHFPTLGAFEMFENV